MAGSNTLAYCEQEKIDERTTLLDVKPEKENPVNRTCKTLTKADETQRSRWQSIRIMYFTMFFGCLSFSICISSLWPYLKLVDSTSNAAYLGWVVASYSLGQLVASPFFGAWYNCRRSTKEPLVVSLSISALANFLYGYVESFPRDRTLILLVSRTFIGFGSGNIAVVRSYISEATSLKERTAVVANLSVFQSLGFILGPAIQTAIVPLGYPGPVSMTEFHLDLYTLPAFLSTICNIVNILLILFVFKHHCVDDFEDRGAAKKPDADQGTGNPEPDFAAVGCTLILFFVVLSVFSLSETILTPFVTDEYGWTSEKVTFYVGLLLSACGLVSVFVFVAIKNLTNRYKERYLLVIGFIITLIGCLMYLPWGKRFPSRPYLPIPDNATQDNSTTAVPRGCPWSYTWCSHTPVPPIEQFVCATIIITIGYATCNVLVNTLFSKILGPKPQGVLMGILTATGCLARTLGPVFVGNLYKAYGPRVTYIAVSSLILSALFLTMVIFRRLVPLYQYHDNKAAAQRRLPEASLHEQGGCQEDGAKQKFKNQCAV